ncbi:MAG: cbb3-type cytochrome c oxidase subunit II [Candidatus Melainabacteria bacterium]|nr:cbb3-type cytochrome c oxidase subunit II [Candidatus Melainabacteria bacterium]
MNKNYILPGFVILVSFSLIIFTTVLLPHFIFHPEPSEYAVEYTELEAKGRDIYRREGCVYCHSQFVRLQDRGFGPLVQAGDYVYDTPNLLGTIRTGPDLSNEGGKHPDAWHKAHFINPRTITPGSIMPPFVHLKEDDMEALIAYVQSLGKKRLKKYDRIYRPDEYVAKLEKRTVDVNSSAAANAGRGIFQQNCATCHGTHGLGNGPNAIALAKKPANFSRPFYKDYDDVTWFWRVSEGVPGTRMPQWRKKLTDEQMWYLVAFLKTLPRVNEVYPHSYETLEPDKWLEQLKASEAELNSEPKAMLIETKGPPPMAGGGH